MPTPVLETPVGLLVAERPGRAEALERFGIDYCCGGKLTIRWFCKRHGLDPEAVLAAIDAADRALVSTPARHWPSAPMHELIAHIVTTHHAYLRKTLPTLVELADTVAEAHGAVHPELNELAAILPGFSAEMLAHLDQEEQVLFPLVVRMERGLEDRALGRRFLTQQLGGLEAEHEAAGGLLARMAALTDGFEPPSDACASYEVLLKGLAAMAADTYRHVHKENSILFPRAAALIEGAIAPPAEARSSWTIVHPEKRPADPLRDEATRAMTHRGGLVSARVELY